MTLLVAYGIAGAATISFSTIAEVVDNAGTARRRRELTLPTDGSMSVTEFPLTGLPSGQYRLRIRLADSAAPLKEIGFSIIDPVSLLFLH